VSDLLASLNRLIVWAASLAMLVASLILTGSVIVRYWLHWPTYWQDEASVFLLVGATFLSAAWIQQQRGHVAIEAITSLLPASWEPIRQRLVDLISFAFCGFFAWKSWTLLAEAWEEGQRSPSTWAPPLWIPYSVMAVGFSLLSLQILLQLTRIQRQTGK
jgi:TRAP-type C4-dicarboxylate transport system permease small subunit